MGHCGYFKFETGKGLSHLKDLENGLRAASYNGLESVSLMGAGGKRLIQRPMKTSVGR